MVFQEIRNVTVGILHHHLVYCRLFFVIFKTNSKMIECPKNMNKKLPLHVATIFVVSQFLSQIVLTFAVYFPSHDVFVNESYKQSSVF